MLIHKKRNKYGMFQLDKVNLIAPFLACVSARSTNHHTHAHTQINNRIIRQLSLPTEANLTDTSQNLKLLRNKANLTDTSQTLKLLRNKNKLTLTGLRVGCRMSSKGGNKSKTRLWGLLNLRTIGAISVIMVANKFLALSSFWFACLYIIMCVFLVYYKHNNNKYHITKILKVYSLHVTGTISICSWWHLLEEIEQL